MKALVIISRDLEKGSTKYRIVQYADYLRAQGIALSFVHRREVTPQRVAEHDLVFNQKCLLNGWQSRRLVRASRRVIFDFDDAIYTRSGTPFSFWVQWRVNRRFRFWLRNSAVVIAANQYLADVARRIGVAPVVVPMTLDLEAWKPSPPADAGGVQVGWAGSPANLPQLERLHSMLATVLRSNPTVKLAVFCGKAPGWSLPCEYHHYQPGAEVGFVQRLDIGLLPLVEDDFTRGKSPIKSLQYLACGVPVVGNVFGATQEILQPTNSLAVTKDSDWITALETLINNRTQRIALGQAGRRFVEANHDLRQVRYKLLALLKETNA